MAALSSLFEGMGFHEVATFIASGNLVFSSGSRDPRKLELKIQKQLQASLGYEVPTFVRSAQEVVSIGHRQVFAEEARKGATVHVAFLHEPLAVAEARKLERIRTEYDEFRVLDREYYWLCRTRTLESTVWKLPEMKLLRLPVSTMRNMTSLRKLIAKHLSGQQR